MMNVNKSPILREIANKVLPAIIIGLLSFISIKTIDIYQWSKMGKDAYHMIELEKKRIDNLYIIINDIDKKILEIQNQNTYIREKLNEVSESQKEMYRLLYNMNKK